MGTAGARFSSHSPAVYRRLRADTAHPVLFDHPVDHAPGMLLLEAARQAAQAVAAPEAALPVSMDAVFFRYAELDAPCRIEADPGEPDSQGRRRTRITAHQDDRVVFCATMTTEPVAGKP